MVQKHTKVIRYRIDPLGSQKSCMRNVIHLILDMYYILHTYIILINALALIRIK